MKEKVSSEGKDMQQEFALATESLEDFLSNSDIVDYENELIKDIAFNLSAGVKNEIELAKKVYEYVRDDIAHSCDINGEIVTCKASEVLKYRQGICYAKSHLLAAILRSLGIPTGFCYQKLILSDEDKPWLVVHGLNAIYLRSIGKWIRVDARGNKEGVNAEFLLDQEKLAFPIRKELGEEDVPVIYASPNKNIIKSLKTSKSVDELIDNLPQAL